MKRSLQDLVRKNIWDLKPYSSARDEFSSKASVYLDANENPFDTGVNRYPDSAHIALKEEIANRLKVRKSQILLGNGSDEILDLMFRSFCEPGQDNIIIAPPTYGMYQVIADINDIGVRAAPLTSDFHLDVENILAQVDEHTKIIMICSPNNPSGNSINPTQIKTILDKTNCIVSIDEAYIDFSKEPSWVRQIENYPNLIVTQTFSKAWGMAGIRLGIGIGSPEVIEVLHRVKPPYNINSLTEAKALEGLSNPAEYDRKIEEILQQRSLLISELNQIEFIDIIFPSDANFVLARVKDADTLYRYLMEKGIIVRNRSNQFNCENTLRITVGTSEENAALLDALKEFNS